MERAEADAAAERGEHYAAFRLLPPGTGTTRRWAARIEDAMRARLKGVNKRVARWIGVAILRSRQGQAPPSGAQEDGHDRGPCCRPSERCTVSSGVSNALIIGASGNQEVRFLRRSVLAILVIAAVPACAEGPVRLVTAGAFSDVKLSTTTRSVHYETVIESDTQVKAIRIVLTPFTGPSRVSPRCTVDEIDCAKGFDLEAGGGKALRIDAEGFDSWGVYNAILSIVRRSGRQSIFVSVTRNAPPAMPVKILPVAKIEESTLDTLSLRFTLQETGGATRTLHPPEIADLALERTGKGRRAVTGFTAKSYVHCGTAEQTTQWELPANALLPVCVNLGGLDEPGEYKALVRFTSPDTQSIDQTVTIDIRRHRAVAAFWIALGVIVSYLLHMLATLRPWLSQQRTAMELADDLEAATKHYDPVEDEQTVVAAISDQLGALIAKFDASQRVATADDTLREIDNKLTIVRMWIPARRRVKALPPAVAAAVMKTIDDGADALRTTGFDAAKRDAVAKSLAGLGTIIDAEITKDLTARIAAMKRSLPQPAALIALPAQQRLQANVIPSVDAAEKAIGANAVMTARTEYAKAQSEYARVLMDEMSARLEQPLPAGFEEADWTRLQADVRALLQTAAKSEGEAAVRAARSALGAYVAALAGALAKRARDGRTIIEATIAIDAAQRPLLATQAGEVAADASAAALQAVGGEVERAEEAYRAALAKFSTISTRVAAFGAQLGGGAAENPAAGTVATPDLSDLPISIAGFFLPRANRIRHDPRFWRGLITRLDTIVLIVALVLAVTMGIELLWESNATWGSGCIRYPAARSKGCPD
jgi:hypothetical protein